VLEKIPSKKSIIPVNLHDTVDQGLLARKIMVVEKAFRIELLGHARAAVINRNAAGAHAIDKFFRDVARTGLIFKGQVEFVRLEKFMFGLRQERDGEPDIVERAPGGINLLAPVEFLEEVGAQARLAIGVGRHEAAELGLLPGDLLPLARLFD
jgi:hypothetical protein